MPPLPLSALRRWLRRHPGTHRHLRRAVFGAAGHVPMLRHALARLADPHGSLLARRYPEWARQNDTITDAQAAAIAAGVAGMAAPPLISVVMPAYQTPEAALRAAIASVRAQIYPHWELCIADDASPAPHVAAVLAEAAAQDARIRFVRRERNGHISAASNTALALARGDFVALMDHDDLLPPHALAAVAQAIAEHPGVQVLFSDEDKVDEQGRRSDPHFKPGWNPELLLTQNIVSHLGVYRRDLLERIGGFREGFEGSQDWDLALRATAGLRPAEVCHIPMVLYHWRQGTGAASFSEGALERCATAGRRAVTEQLEGRGEPGVRVLAQPDLPGWSRVAHPLPTPLPRLSIVLSRPADAAPPDRGALLLPPGLEAEILSCPPAGPLEAARGASGDVVLFLDPALRPEHPEWLPELLSHALRPEVGAVGALVLDETGHVLEAGRLLDAATGRAFPVSYLLGAAYPSLGYYGHLRLPRQVSAVVGDVLALRRDRLPAARLPEPVAAADWATALCRALAAAGHRIVFTPAARLRRTGRVAVPSLPLAQGLRDPFFNPNLSATRRGLRLSGAPGGAARLAAALQQPEAARPHA